MNMASDHQLDSCWSTRATPGSDVMESWSELLSTNIAEMNVESPSRNDYHAVWRRYGLGPVILNFIDAAPQRVQRTTTMIRRQRTADFDLLFMHTGTAGLHHCGETVHVPEGSFVLLDNQETYDLTFADEHSCLTTHIEDRWLRRWIAQPRSLAARPIAGDREWGVPLAALLRTMSSQGLSGAALPRSVIADQFGALLALMSGETRSVASRHQTDLLQRLKRVMKDRFDDAELDPVTLAAEFGISKRHLHGVFAKAGTTFGHVLLEMRLTHAAELMQNPRFSSHRVGDVAWACGFGDPSHFARRFRERFGVSPLAYRTEVGRDTSLLNS